MAENPQVTEVWPYKEFVAGEMPKTFELPDSRPRGFVPLRAEANATAIKQAINAAVGLKQTRVLWMMSLRSKRIQPEGLVVLLNNRLTLPGNDEVVLE